MPTFSIQRLRHWILILCFSFGFSQGEERRPTIPAFPGAEGFGAQAMGGRGGRVYAVTTLDDYDPKVKKAAPIEGSLRWAVS